MIVKADIDKLVRLFNALHDNSSGSNTAEEMWVREIDMDVLASYITILQGKV